MELREPEINLLIPLPMDKMATTDETPIMMPSIVRKARTLFERILKNAIFQ